VAISLSVHILSQLCIFANGSDEQKQRFLPPMTAGRELGAFALTEPGAGSDAAALETRAVRDGDDWLISGNKIFVTCGPVADYVLVLARSNDAPRAKGVSAFIVDTALPGVVRGPKNRKMGYNGATPNCDFFFDSVRRRWPPRRSASPRARSRRPSPTRRNAGSSASRSPSSRACSS
jgi:hypothetical protein